MSVKKYDSLLYGYGASLSLFNSLRTDPDIKTSVDYLEHLDLGDFIQILSESKDHSYLMRNFIKLFPKTHKENEYRDITFKEIRSRIDEIKELGFERWVAKYLFRREAVTRDLQLNLYFIHNYWHSHLHDSIFTHPLVQKKVEYFSHSLLDNLKDSKRIFTTNFDTFVDPYLSPQHVHGKFVHPCRAIGEIIEPKVSNDETYDYHYLFGTNGFEKSSRLRKLHKVGAASYDLDFLFSDSIQLGHLLIYGLSLNSSGIIPDHISKKHQDSFLSYPDGHLLNRFRALVSNGQLDAITIAYYNQEDLDRYKYISKIIKLDHITTYINSESLIQIKQYNRGTT